MSLKVILAILCIGAALLFLLRGDVLIGGLLLVAPAAHAVHRSLRGYRAETVGVAYENFVRLADAGFTGHDIFEGDAILGVDRRRHRIAVADGRGANVFPLARVEELVARSRDDGRSDLLLRLRGGDGERQELRLASFASDEAARAVHVVTRLAAEARTRREESQRTQAEKEGGSGPA